MYSPFTVISIVANLCIQLLSMRCLCSILEMRSNVAFCLTTLAYFFLGLSFRVMELPAAVHAIGYSIPLTFVIPVLFSKGPLIKRMVRTALYVLFMTLSEIVGIAAAILLLGEQATFILPASAEAQVDPVIAACIYLIALFAAVLVFELLILICRRFDEGRGSLASLPPVVLLLVSFHLHCLLLIRFNNTDHKQVALVIYILCVVVTVLTCLAMLDLSYKDLQVSRENANRATALRQARHLRAKIEASTRLSMDARRLRHDLANQIGIVSQLATQGHRDDADRYLAALQQRADGLSKESHE